MPRLTWDDVEEIAMELRELYPRVDPYTVRFTDLHRWIVALPGFADDRTRNVEGVLETIQARWAEESQQDA